MPDEAELQSAIRQRSEQVARTLRQRMGPPLSELSGAKELDLLTNDMKTIQTGDTAEALMSIRTVRAWIHLREHELVSAARAAKVPWKTIAEEIGLPLGDIYRTHNSRLIDPADMIDT